MRIFGSGCARKARLLRGDAPPYPEEPGRSLKIFREEIKRDSWWHGKRQEQPKSSRYLPMTVPANGVLARVRPSKAKPDQTSQSLKRKETL